MFIAFPICRSFNHLIILNFGPIIFWISGPYALNSTQFPFNKLQLQNKKIKFEKNLSVYSSSNESCLRSRIFAFFDFFLDLKPSETSSFFGIMLGLILASAVISSSSFQLCSKWSSSILFSEDFDGSFVAEKWVAAI